MNEEQLKEYVEANKKLLIAEVAKYLDEEDGVWIYWGEIALIVYYDAWEDEECYYRVTAHPLRETKDGMLEEDMDIWVDLAEIKVGL